MSLAEINRAAAEALFSQNPQQQTEQHWHDMVETTKKVTDYISANSWANRLNNQTVVLN